MRELEMHASFACSQNNSLARSSSSSLACHCPKPRYVYCNAIMPPVYDWWFLTKQKLKNIIYKICGWLYNRRKHFAIDLFCIAWAAGHSIIPHLEQYLAFFPSDHACCRCIAPAPREIKNLPCFPCRRV